jgi:hypothetical protein
VYYQQGDLDTLDGHALRILGMTAFDINNKINSQWAKIT